MFDQETERQLLLEDFCEAGKRILSYTEGMSYFDFTNDNKTVDAVVRNMEIMQEDAGRVPDDYKAQHISFPWPKVADIRSRIFHDYFTVDHQAIWQLIKEDLPELLENAALLTHEP